MNQNIHSINNSSIIDEKIPKGYKKTSVGTIPEDWSVKTLGKLGEFKNGLNKSSGDFGSGQEMVNLNDVFEKRSLNSLDSFSTMVKCNQKEINEYSLKQGDVLFVRSSVKPEGVGLTTLIEEDLNDKVYSGFIIRYRDKGDDLELYYKKYCFDATYFRRKLLNYSTISANTNINQKSLEKLEVIIPSKAEQKEIASILLTWDKAIELKEKLIEQKKEQKKGLMQKLLTGEVRLPGFDSKWSNVKIGNIIKEINEKSTVNNQFQVLSVTKDGIVSQSEHFKKQVASDNNIGYKIIRKNNLVFSTMNLWMGSLDVLTNYEVGLVSPAYKVFKFNDEVMDPIFGKYFMKTEHMIWLYNVNSEQGASVVRRNLDLKGLLNTYVNIPSLEEQRNIARVIFCLDTEIDLLEHETKQLIKQKKGLMQLLLTGKVRVKV